MCQWWKLALCLAVCVPAHAQDVRQLYTQSELERIGARYAPNLRGLWSEDFLSRVTREERLRAGAVALNLPLVGANHYPLDYYADSRNKQVYIPIASVKFLDDLSVAFAYYEQMGCDSGPISDYVGVLRFRPREVTGSPLVALGIPSTATKDVVVDDIAQKLLNSIVFFIVAHEYAHVMYQHKSYDAISAREAQSQEVEADAYALEVMRRIGVPPIAMAHFFFAASRLEASPIEFASLGEYEAYLRRRSTHPISSSRILRVAEEIEANAGAFARLQPDPPAMEKRLRKSVEELRGIGNSLDDREMRTFLGRRALAADVDQLRRGCRR